MEKILPGVYRFSVGKRGRSYSYLLLRKQGNLLICHANRGSSVVDFHDEVEHLGGIAYQFVCEGADAARGELHEQLYERFGCTLHCHERDRKKIEKETKKWDQLIVDRSTKLKAWSKRLREILEMKIDVYGYFNNHYAGFAPGSLRMLEEILDGTEETGNRKP